MDWFCHSLLETVGQHLHPELEVLQIIYCTQKQVLNFTYALPDGDSLKAEEGLDHYCCYMYGVKPI